MTNEDQKNRAAREVVGVFGDAAALDAAASELLASGFETTRLSLLAGEKAIVEKLGHKYRKVEELEDNLEAPRTVYRSTESFGLAKTILFGGMVSIGALAAGGAILAAGGPLAATLATGLIGGEAGGFIGGYLTEYVETHHARYIEDQLGHGGLLLWVRTLDDAEEAAAKKILSAHSGRDVHSHAVPEQFVTA